MQAVREAVGEDIEIVFDVHTRLDLADAVTLCARLSLCTPSSWKNPLRAENPDSFKTLRLRTSAPLAAGEQFLLEMGVPPAHRRGMDRLRAY